MRSFIIIVSAIFVASLAFIIYWMMSGAEVAMKPQSPEKKSPPVIQAPTTTAELPGGHAWWKRLDSRTGEVTSMMRANSYERQPDGRFYVTNPDAVFFMSGQRVMRLVGRTGYISTQEALSHGHSSGNSNMAAQTPRSGELRDVVLEQFTSLDAMNHGEKPEVTVLTPSASFDNESFLIQTEPYTDEKGNRVRADEVPVTMRGKYEFDGRGMVLQYDELDRHLRLLRIAHGQRLKINDPKGMSIQPMPVGATAAAYEVFPEPLAAADNTVLAQAGKPERAPRAGGPRRAASRRAPMSRPTIRRSTEEPVYHATFMRDVEVFQGTKKVALAREMDILFLQEEEDSDPLSPSTRPTTQRSARTRPARAGATTRPAHEPRIARSTTRPSTAPARVATTAPATQPAEPLEIRWSGPLTVVPLTGQKPERIAPGERIIKFTGDKERPVDLFFEMQNGSEKLPMQLRCATCTYWTMDQGALLEEGKDLLVEATDARGPKGIHVLTHRAIVSQVDQTVTLLGSSKTQFPIEQQAEKPGQPPKVQIATADWSDKGTFGFEGELTDFDFRRAILEGAVFINHPLLNVHSNTLDTILRPKTKASTQPSTFEQMAERITADGNVHAVAVEKETGQTRILDGDHAVLETTRGSSGKYFFRNVLATGSVHVIYTPEVGDIHCGYLNLVLAEPLPRAATRPAGAAGGGDESLAMGNIESYLAHDDVRVVRSNGEIFTGKFSEGAMFNKQMRGTLTGTPATVIHGSTKITGPVIAYGPGDQPGVTRAVITGAGRAQGVQETTTGGPGRPFDLTWTRNAEFAGDDGQAEGDVLFHSIDSDGSRDTAKGDRLLITMMRPTTQPTTKPATRMASGKHSSTQPSDSMDLMGNRQVKTITLIGNAQTDSLLSDAGGNLLRLMRLNSQRIEFHQVDPKHKKIVIPQAGTMLFMDNRPPANTAEAQAAAKDPMSMRGSTAFKWNDSLVYDEMVNQLTMLGSVVIGRLDQNQAAGAKPLQIMGDKVVADIEPAPEPTTRPATQPAVVVKAATRPATQPGGLAGEFSNKLQIKKVHVEGDPLIVQNDQLDLRAQTMDYDPVTHLLVARGDGRKRVRQLGTDGLEDASFDEFIYNTEKAAIVGSKGIIMSRRK